MFQSIKTLYWLLTPIQRNYLFKLQILIVIASFTEVASILIIVPYMSVIKDLSSLQDQGVWAEVYTLSGADTSYQFLLWLSYTVLIIMIISALLSILTKWRMSLFSYKLGEEISQRLYSFYLCQPWLFHSNGNSSYLVKQITQETQRVTRNVIEPLLSINTKLVMIIFILLGLFFYDFWLTFFGAFLFLIAYIFIYKIIKKKLYMNSIKISQITALRSKLIYEGLGGIKELLVLNRQYYFSWQFIKASTVLAKIQGVNAALGSIPRYVIELIAFSSMLLLILYLLSTNNKDIGSFLPVLATYALASFKMLPAFQQIYMSVTKIKGNLHAFESIKFDLENSYSLANSEDRLVSNTYSEKKKIRLPPQKSITLENITFTYPERGVPTVSGIYLDLPVRKTIALVGSSGSGKSTIVDLLLGLIEPQQGCLRVDGVEINAENLVSWQSNIGYVPQSVFLADASIYENIAFGLPEEEIDKRSVLLATKMAHLENFIAQLPDGFSTRVGERGVKISGGERQRIGIARALYHDADVLIFDEATSSLDSITEKVIMDAIYDFSGEKTIIIIAHRFKTIKNCDFVYLLGDNGMIMDTGSYEELVSRNDFFSKLSV